MSGPIVETLWVPGHKERATRSLNQRRFGVTGITTAASSGVGTGAGLCVCPNDTIRIISGVSWLLSPGAAQVAMSAYLTHFANVADSRGNAGYTFPINLYAVQQGRATLTGIDWMMFPSDFLSGGGTFNAGAAINTLQVWVWGYDLPRGNIEL